MSWRFSHAIELAGALLVFCLIPCIGPTLSSVQAEDAASESGLGESAKTFGPGDIAVTGFSGTILASDKLPPGVDPLDRTFIDPSSASLRVFEASSLNGPPVGQTLNAPLRLDVPAKDIGQVFGLAFDQGDNGGAPNLFVAATSAFGLRIVGAGIATDGKPVRLKVGAPDATFMEAQFGSLGSGSPGAIYKMNGSTGAVTYIADTAFSGVQNSGPGIGGVAFDPASHSLYASDLDTGLIHRFGLDYNAADLSQFDHGVAGRRAKGLPEVPDDGRRLDILSPDFHADDPATWGFTQPQRRVDALAVHDGRLYYAVADGPEIWSVELKGGAFGDDARREVAIKAEKFIVTGIAFDGTGHMILAQRGPVKNPYDYGSFTDGGGQALRYTPETPDDPKTPDLWAPDPASYAVGSADGNNAGTGGVSLQYGYKPDGSIDTTACDGSVALTGDTLATTVSGVQLNSVELVRPANVPPTQSAFINYDPRQDDPKVLGHVGNVSAMRLCGAGTGFPPVEAGTEGPPVEGAEGAAPPVEGGGGGGGGTTAPPVEEGGGGTTAPPVDEGGGGTTAPPVEEGDGISITKSAGPGTCTEKGGCSFTINVTNNAAEPVQGPIVINEELTAGAANLAGAKIEGAPTPPWTCTAPPKFTCTHPGPIAAGESVPLNLSFTPTGIGQEKSLQNCATLQPLGAAPGPAPQPAVPQPAGAEFGGVKVEQKPLSAQCSVSAGCDWEITLTNSGGTPKAQVFMSQTITGPKGDRIPADVQVLQSPEGFLCGESDAKVFSCLGKNATLAPGQSVTFKVKVTPKVSANDPAVQSGPLQSGVFGSIDQTGGLTTTTIPLQEPVPAAQPAAEGQVPVDQTPACATVPVNADGGGGKTEAGPITIEKTPAVKSCDAATPCSFDIKVSNTSGKDIPGPITIAETPPDGVKTSNPPAPWNCVAAAGPTRSCTHPGPVPANGSLQPPLSFTFPPPAGATLVENCATLGAPLPAGIPAPANPACATIPTTPPPPATIFLVKNPVASQCSDLGGGCAFMISINNPGPGEFNGVITFTDEATAADGTPFKSIDFEGTPQAIQQPGVTAPFSCKKEGTGFTCSTGVVPAKIPAGMTVQIPMSFKPGPANGATAIKNCAALPGQEKQCRNIPLVNGPLLRAEKTSGSVTCNPKCTFAITVKNVGNAVARGPFTFQDVMTPQAGTIEAVSGDFKCGRTGNILKCNSKKGDLAPGDSFNGVVDVFAPLAPSYTNCVELTGNIPIVKDFPGRCFTIKETKPERPDLRISKLVERPRNPADPVFGDCDLKGTCKFQIVIQNNGNAPFTGPITINDEVPKTTTGGATQSFPTAIEHFPTNDFDWNCTKNSVRAISCTSKKPVTIEAGRILVFEVAVTPGSSWKKNDQLQNCASVVVPEDVHVNAQACATYVLDPFDVKVAKTGDQSCQPGGECRFDIDIFDPGPIPHHAPVTVTDKLSGLASAQIVSITPAAGADAFPCKPAPTQIPFSCTGDMDMEPGEQNHYTMIVRLPADASAAAFTNCATVGGGRSSGETSDPSCHLVQLAPPEQPFSLKIEKTGPASCAPGSECPFDITLTNTGSKDHKGAVTLTDGLSNAPAMSIVSITPPLPCSAQPAEIPFTCKTADDFAIPAGGKRTFRVTARVPRSAGTFTNCAIIASVKAPRSGGDDGVSSCHTVEASTPAQTTEKPQCKGGMILLEEGECACPPNQEWNGRTCTEPRTPLPSRILDGGGGGVIQPCPPERPIGDFPDCCPVGTRFAHGVCRRTGGTTDTPPPVCKGARPVGEYPDCCPVGTRFAHGVCRRTGGTTGTPPPVCKGARPVGEYPDCCPVGTRFAHGACHRLSGGTGPGNGGTNGRPLPVCKGARPVGEYPDCCPVGTRFAHGACHRLSGGTGPGNGGTNGRPLPVCKGARPVGEYPDCCPVGTRFAHGVCRRTGGTGPGTGGTGGTQPTGVCKGDRPVGEYPHCCPVGTRFAHGVCRRTGGTGPGAGGTGGTQPTGVCKGDRPVGEYPDCCPVGTRFAHGICRRLNGGTSGTKPCPPGTHSTRSGQCETNASPTTKPAPATGKCTRGRMGTPPNCFCRPGTQFMGGRCRTFRPKRAPKKSDDKVIVR